MIKKLTLTANNALLGKIRWHSKLSITLWAFSLLIIAFVSGCKKDDFGGEITGLCPVVSSTDPTDKAVDVALNKVISVTFNTSMKAATINNTTFTIKRGTTVIPGTIAPTANKNVFTFTPTSTSAQPELLPFTDYKGTISTGATDTLRTAMVSNYEWSFKTIPQVTVSSTVGGTATPTFTSAQNSVTTVSVLSVTTGYVFVNWTNGTDIVSTSPSYTFTMAGNRTLVANFAQIPPGNFVVNVSAFPAVGGNPTGPTPQPAGSVVTVSANPNANYVFNNWTENGNPVSTNLDYQFVLTGNRTLVANYTIIGASQFAINLTASPAAGGDVSGGGTYPAGSSRTVSTTIKTGYTFVSWKENGNAVSTSPSYTFALTGNRTLVANFTLNTYTLTVPLVAGGGASKNPNPSPASTTSTHNYGDNVILTATPLPGYVFTSWSGSAGNVNTNPLTVTMDADKTITPIFTLIPVQPALFTSIFGAFGGNAGITNQGVFTVINNGSIATTGVSTKITGFHDITGDKYIETGLNIGNVKDGRIYTDAPPPVIFGPGGPFGGNVTTKAIADAGLIEATAFYNSISPAQKPGGIVQAQELGGLTLFPGTYKAASGPFEIKNGNLTLDAQGNPNAVWIFQATSSLTVGLQATGGARSVILINGALAKNVYWYVGSAAEINYAGGGVMVGTIVSTAGVTLSSPANSTNTLVQTVLNGRAISLVASVTMVNTIINVPAP